MSFLPGVRRHAGTVVLLTVFAAAAGALCFAALPSAIYPRLEFPRILVLAHGGTLPPQAMALTVTRPLEEVTMEVPGIRRVRSRTLRGSTEISAQFLPGTDMVQALQQVQNRVAETLGELPAGTAVDVERLLPETFPMLSLNLTGALPDADLRDYAFYVIRPALARVPGVGRLEVAASDTREIEVAVDPGRMAAAGLTVGDVAAALRDANVLEPIARYSENGRRQRLVLLSSLWKAAADIAATPVVVRGISTLRVRDLGTVFPGAPDRDHLIVGNGRDAAVVSVSQQPGADMLAVKAGVESALAGLARSLPAGLRLSKVYDLAEFVGGAVANVRDAIVLGGILAALVLLLFLRDWRLTLVSALTLPLTVLATFVVMRLLGESVNLMSMGGLAVAIGLVIDDAVVVVENIHRKLARGSGQSAETGAAVEPAIDEATAELVAPVVGSTVTTVVVLVPLGLLSGVVGQFFRSLSLTLSAAVLISLVLALTLIPLATGWLHRRRAAHSPAGLGAPGGHLATRYASSLAAALRRPRLMVAAAFALALLGYLLFRVVPSGFLPAMDEGGFVVDYQTPPGTALEETDRLLRGIERVLAKTHDVAAFSRRTGSELGLFATPQNSGDVLVRLKPRRRRSRSADEIIADLRPRLLQAAPGVEIEFVQLLQDMIGDLEGNPTPIEVKIFGDDERVLAALAARVEPILAGTPGVVDVVGVQMGSPETAWHVDPAAAERLGLTPAEVASQVAGAFLGEVATDLRLLDRRVPVRVRFSDAARADPQQMALALIRGPGGAAPLAALGRPELSEGQSEVTRENLRQMALLTARLESGDLGGAVADLRARLDKVTLPAGYSLEVGGQYESQRQAFRELLTVFAAAAALVLVVLVFQFRALLPALLILLAAPLSLAGSLLLLLLTGTELNVSSAMGLILLIGLVVKNGIVMLDYAHRLRDGGLPLEEAVAEAARVRLRPILMTTLCTLFGLLPLALGLGAGAELQRPLALAVIGGLGLSTLVTLYGVPSWYVAAAGALRRRRRAPNEPAG
ncbi:MAG TPA: efflux RND transporter permease subunit [Thermoanaerobaculia bacterium]|nr:efflux RND transporter permease subunit [Thermoanaerobaculia bacterium]